MHLEPANGPSGPARGWARERSWVLAVLGIILLVSFLRVLHLGFPLERDEGEFGYIAQEMLRGVPMYESAYTQKLPGTYLFYALFLSVFGQSIVAIHLGLLLVNAAIMWLIFLTLRRTHGGAAGCAGAFVFGLMALSPTVFGFAAHATFFVSLFAVAGLYTLVVARERGHTGLFFLSGLCFGLAFVMKQSGVFFAAAGLGMLAIDHFGLRSAPPARSLRHALALSAGTLTPPLLTAAWFAALGKFSRFWFWTFQFPGEFSSQVGVTAAVRNLFTQTSAVMSGFELLWVLALIGLFATWRDKALGPSRYLYPMFTAASLLSVVPGFYFTAHYYVSALPAVAILVGALAGEAASLWARRGRRPAEALGLSALMGLAVAIPIARHGGCYFGRVADEEMSRKIYFGNPFPESIAIGDYLKRHTSPEDRVAILGSETQILFYSQRRSASRFVNTYFLTADHPRNREMQQEMIHDIEQARPKYVMLVMVPASWSFRPNSPLDILGWLATYLRGRYGLEGIVELSGGASVVTWGPEARAHPVRSDLFIKIWRRLDAPSP